VSEPRLIRVGDGEVIADSPERRIEIVCEHDALHATSGMLAPSGPATDLHVHRRHADLFYVLEGELTVRLGVEDRGVAIGAGTLARVPPLVVHGFRNDGDAEVRYLNLHAPGVGFADYLRALRDGRTPSFDQHPPPADGSRPTTDAAIGGGDVLIEGAELRVALLADDEDIAIADTTIGSDGPEERRHVHHRHVESVYVLEGELAVSFSDGEVRVPAGAWVDLPAGVDHAVASAGPQPARFLDVHAPSCGFGPFLRALHTAADSREVEAARAAFDEESV
jgi:mannose-6-phosphate isomerase-like protein (cupin superfamily)